nr:hypothetical protein [Tanacetum cinerariifolium]
MFLSYQGIRFLHSADYSSSDHFTSDDSSRESSSETSSEFHSDTSPDSSLRHSSSASSIPRALSYVPFDLLSPRKRIKDYDFVTDFDVSSKEGYVPYVPKQIGLAVDVGDSYEPYTPGIDPDVKEDIDACIAFTDDIAARGTYARRPSLVREGRLRLGLIRVTHLVVSDDAAEPVREDYPDLVCAVGYLEGHRIVVTSQQSAAMSEMISTLERDNMRLRGINMPAATHFGMAQDAINEPIAKCVAEALDAYGVPRNPVTETEMENEQQDDNVKANVNNGNGNGNGNGNPNVNNEGNVIAAELTRLHDVIRIANNLMDQKFKGYAVKNAENKRRKAYVGTLHYYNKCSMHHEGPCTVKCGNCKRVSHMTRDFKAAVAATALRSPIRNQTGVTCYECGREGHYRTDRRLKT